MDETVLCDATSATGDVAASFLIQLFANRPAKAAENGPSAWALAAYVGDQDAVPEASLRPGPVLSAVVIWGMNP